MSSNTLSMTAGLSLLMSQAKLAEVSLAFDRAAVSLHRFVATRIGNDSHTVDDILQQVWFRAAASDAEIPSAEIEPWLFGIARNLVREHWRRQKRRPQSLPVVDGQLAADLARRMVDDELPADVLERREARDQVLLAITLLRSEEQELIVGFYFKGRSTADLAERLGVSSRAIEGRLYRARQVLRERLERLEQQEGQP